MFPLRTDNYAYISNDRHTIAHMQGGAILFSEMTPDASCEDEFNEWYDDEHIPLRMVVAGFGSAQRYRIRETRNYLVVYEMDSLRVLQSPAYLSVKNNPSDRTKRMLSTVSGFTRYLAEETGSYTIEGNRAGDLDAPFLYSVFFEVPPERQRDFNDWYENDHVPQLLECKDWLLVRRFRIVDGEPKSWTHLALHYLTDDRALESGERRRARQSPWRARLAEESWFTPQYSVHHKHGSRR
jgi:hypothetical protein